jgi:hypothetical protein
MGFDVPMGYIEVVSSRKRPNGVLLAVWTFSVHLPQPGTSDVAVGIGHFFPFK